MCLQDVTVVILKSIAESNVTTKVGTMMKSHPFREDHHHIYYQINKHVIHNPRLLM